ncbi:MAG TPA: TonB-dependent receptor plug domain-containing protein, partial [Gemmatimonadaceae bacterium]|nr:TonB-dependent receptor plug domain-containing protein [Gemmatimonadaceae bacterium]
MRRLPMLVIRTITATLVCLGSVAVKVPAQSLAVITGTVRNAVNGAPVANATVRVLDERRSYVTSGDGTFRLALGRPEAELHVTAVGFAPDARRVPLTAGASVVITIELQPSAVPLDEVITLGTRALERTATSSAVPIDVISNQLLENTGVVETWQQLQRLVPSVFAPHIPLTDNGMRPITLRGLAPHHTLVLVNGKRQHPAAALLSGPSVPNTTFTDLNAIPGSAIDHIEVLRDGASAEYGSDAIGGVVNVVLKSGNRRDLRTTVGQVYSSEGGRTWRDGRMFDADGTFGLVAENGSYLTLTGELRDRDGTNRSYPDQRQQYFTGDSRNDQPPRISSNLGDGDVNGLSFFLNGAFPLNRATELYAFAGAAHRNNVSPDAFFRRPLDSATVRAIFPDGFLPRIESKIGDVSAVVGMRGSVHGWRWDVSTGSGANRIAYRVENSNNVSLGAASPTSFYAGRIAAQQWTSNADVSRDVMIGSLPLTLAGGMELRVEKYLIRAGDPDSWRDGGVRILDGPQLGRPAATGSQGLTGFRPADEVSPRRTNSAFYLEAEGRPFQRLLLQSAVRAEHYSDAGSTSDGKLAGRVELLKGIAVRGSMSSGFRAPALSEEYFSRTTTVFRQVGGVGTFLTTRTFPVNTREAQLMGATKLRP